LSGNTYTTGAITGDCTVSASFERITYTVSTSAGAGGSISPTSRLVGHDLTTTFGIYPNLGYGIDSVSGCGGSLSGNTFTTGAITGPCTVTAIFSKVPNTYDFANLGAASGGFKPQGERFLVSESFENDQTVMYTSTSPVSIKADGTNLVSFDLEDFQFSGYD